MKLYFIRHGQTDWNVQGKIQGSYDSDLNEVGLIQAKELGRKVIEDDYKFSKIYTSPQKRAVKTAEILSKAINVDYLICNGLEEMNLGQWEGLTWKEVKEIYPSEYEEWTVNRRYTKTPKGESYQDMLERVLKVLHKIIKENRGNIAIVTHSAVIMCLQCYITNTIFNEMLKFKIGNTTIVEIDSKFI